MHSLIQNDSSQYISIFFYNPYNHKLCKIYTTQIFNIIINMGQNESSQTLLFHDTFLMRGGAERMNLLIADILHADVATAYVSPESFHMEHPWRKVYITNPNFRRWMLWFLIMKWSFFRSSFVREYKHVIFSNEAISAIHSIKLWTKTYYYAHSISRHLFDQKWQYYKKVRWFLKPLFLVSAFLLKWLYIYEVRKVNVIFTNSMKNQKRIKDWMGRESILLYPPVDTLLFRVYTKDEWKTMNIWLPFDFKSYYLSFSRLTHAKRIDRIIEVAKTLPQKNFLILYGEEDSQKVEFMKLGEWSENIYFYTLPDNSLLPAIISWAIATIAVSREEDFGMVAIESMACGVPIIAVDEWWYRESIIGGETGILIPTLWGDFLNDDLYKAIECMSKEYTLSVTQNCLSRASDFSLEKFREKLSHSL